VMYAGRIVEEAPVDDLFSSTRHPYTEALLAAIPRPSDNKASPLYTIAGQPPDLSQRFDHCVFADRCRYVQDDCWKLIPALAGGTAHRHACFHPVGSDVQPSPALVVQESA